MVGSRSSFPSPRSPRGLLPGLLFTGVLAACTPPAVAPAGGSTGALAASTAPAASASTAPQEPAPGAGEGTAEEAGECGSPPLALALVIDRSGSMTGEPIERAREAAVQVARKVGRCDFLEIVAFDSQPFLVGRKGPGRSAAPLVAAIDRGIVPAGGTEFLSAIEMAHRDLGATAAERKHVIFFTDGQGPMDGVLEVIGAMAGEGVTLSTIGLGGSTDDLLLGRMAARGRGRFVKVGQPEELPPVFLREVDTAAAAGNTGAGAAPP